MEPCKLMLQLSLKDLFKFVKFRYNYRFAIGCITIPVEIILVIVFRNIKSRSFVDRRHYRIAKCLGIIQLLFVFLCYGLLLRIVIEDNRAVLCAYIRTLTV